MLKLQQLYIDLENSNEILIYTYLFVNHLINSYLTRVNYRLTSNTRLIGVAKREAAIFWPINARCRIFMATFLLLFLNVAKEHGSAALL